MDKKQQMLSNMYTFAVAGKCLSFTKAAEELFITQGAVSQRIKSLEEQLGFSLFVRMTRRLELTKEGERLLHALNQSFEVIFSELEDIKFNELRGPHVCTELATAAYGGISAFVSFSQYQASSKGKPIRFLT